MKKTVLQLTILSLLVLAGGFTFCTKEDNDMNVGVKGIIKGYHKCTDFENGYVVFGIYIVTNEKDTLLSYNISHERLCSLLGVSSLENFKQGNLYYEDGSPIIFDYREAEENEIVTISCPQDTFWPLFLVRNVKQVFIEKENMLND
jgi:hypothetical protein